MQTFNPSTPEFPNDNPNTAPEVPEIAAHLGETAVSPVVGCYTHDPEVTSDIQSLVKKLAEQPKFKYEFFSRLHDGI